MNFSDIKLSHTCVSRVPATYSISFIFNNSRQTSARHFNKLKETENFKVNWLLITIDELDKVLHLHIHTLCACTLMHKRVHTCARTHIHKHTHTHSSSPGCGHSLIHTALHLPMHTVTAQVHSRAHTPFILKFSVITPYKWQWALIWNLVSTDLGTILWFSFYKE